jgi:antitoxin HicB
MQATRYSQGGSLIFSAIYPASFIRERSGEGFHVRFPDLPEALTGGDNLGDTRAQAADCLAEAIAGRITRGDDIPQPSKSKRGQYLIGVPLYLAPKLALYLGMRELRVRNTELARRLGVSETVVRRMLDPRHDTKPEKIEAALTALGKRIVVTFEDAA